MTRSPKKRILCAALSLLCILSVFAPAALAVPGNSQTIRVGFFAFDGYHIQDQDGKRSGYGYDFLQQLARYGGWTYEYVGYDKSWADMQEMLENGEIDLLTSAQKTPEREKRFAFSDKAIGTSSAILTVKSGDERYTIGDYATYSGMRIGLLKNNSRNEKLAAFAAEKGFSYTPVYYDAVEEMTAALQSGDGIDAIFSSNLRSIDNEWILDEFDPSDFYVMVRRDDTRLLSEINDAIDQMDINLADWRHELWDRYYAADTGGELAFTAKEKAYLDRMRKSGAVIRAIVEPDRAPYSYFENGEAKGIIPEIFAQIEEMTGLTFDIVEMKSRGEYFSALAGSDIPVRIDAYNDYYDAEQNGCKLTSPYLTASVSVVARRASAEPYASVAAVRRADPTTYRSDLLSSGTRLLQYDTVQECLDAVRDGAADATYVLSYIAQQYLNDSDAAGVLQSTLLPQYSVSYAIGVSNAEDCCLLTVLDKAVTNLSRADVESAILSQTEVIPHGLTLREYLTAHPGAFAALAGAGALLLAMAALLFYRRKSMRLIEGKNRELEAEALRADQASAAKSQFLSSMSHDMRTPLNGVVSFTSFALKANDPEKKQAYLEKARQSAAILMDLINDTLEVSRIESGKMELHEEWTAVRELIGGIALVIESSAGDKGISFSQENDFEEDEFALTDKLKMQDLLMNLLTNAVKYTPAGGAVSLRAVRDRQAQDGKNVRFTVSDNGIGISEEFMPNLFEPFSQERDPALKGVSGTGLGLYIVRRIVSLMNGSIDVESRKGRGTSITVRLPMKLERRAGGHKADQLRQYDFSGKKVLLCEDNSVNTEIACTILREKKITVVCAEDGKQGTELFAQSGAGEFDAILMDIHMPVMDGYTAARTIRAMERPDAARVPIIAMTADAYEEDIAKCLAAGMNSHTAKPVDPDRLFAELARVLRGSGGDAPAESCHPPQ